MTHSNTRCSRRLIPMVAAVFLARFLACGGGSGGDGNPNARQSTTFIGEVNDAAQTLGATTGSPVEVCAIGTDFCSQVSADGAFTLVADIGGDVVLEFTGPAFTARLALDAVPRGATVRISNIVCNLESGVCHAADVDIELAANTPPDCTQAEAQPSELWPPDHALVPIEITGVVDPDGDPLAIAATNVTQNEPVDAPGSGNTAPDAQLEPLAVRAERSGLGNGRIYTIDFIADDGRGGSCTGTVYVCVPHDQGRGADC